MIWRTSMMVWVSKHPQMTLEHLGFLPGMWSDDDPRPAKEQADANYQHGGGWRPFKGFTMLQNGNLLYPGDPMVHMLAETVLHSTTDKPEVIRFYQHDWVAIVQRDGSFEVCRMD